VVAGLQLFPDQQRLAGLFVEVRTSALCGVHDVDAAVLATAFTPDECCPTGSSASTAFCCVDVLPAVN
jgi:hypothetical protein